MRDTSGCTTAWCKTQGGASTTLCGHCTAHRWCVSCGADAEAEHGVGQRWANRNGGRCGECVANGRTDRPFADVAPTVGAEAQLGAWLAGDTSDRKATLWRCQGGSWRLILLGLDAEGEHAHMATRGETLGAAVTEALDAIAAEGWR